MENGLKWKFETVFITFILIMTIEDLVLDWFGPIVSNKNYPHTQKRKNEIFKFFFLFSSAKEKNNGRGLTCKSFSTKHQFHNWTALHFLNVSDVCGLCLECACHSLYANESVEIVCVRNKMRTKDQFWFVLFFFFFFLSISFFPPV